MKKSLLLIAALGMTTGMWGQITCHLDPKVAGLFHCDPDLEVHGNLCSTPDCKLPVAEPMDVPAVKVDTVTTECIETKQVFMNWENGCAKTGPVTHTSYTCSDKRRVLLTGEDLTKHCILFPRTEQAELPSERKIFQADGRPPRCPNDPSCRPPSINPKACCPGQ